MMYEHRPTPVDAVQWTGDLVAIRQFLTAGEEATHDGGVLWVTTRHGATRVFPIMPRHYLVRHGNGVLDGMSTAAFEHDYQPRRTLAAV